MASSSLVMEITANTAKAVSGIESVSKSLAKLSAETTSTKQKTLNFLNGVNQITNVASTISTAIKKVISMSKELVNAYSVQEQAETRLATTLKATGNAIGMSATELYDMASAFQNVTTFGDEAIIEVEKLFVASGKISKDVMPKAVEATLDMAAAMGEDCTSAAKRLAKVLADPKSNLDALKDANIQLSDSQKATVKSLQESNNLYGAQSIILQSVASSYGGVAKALADTDTGKLTQIKNVWGDIKEGLGEGLLDTISPALDTLYGKLTKISEWVSKAVDESQENRTVYEILSGEFKGRKIDELSESELRKIALYSKYGNWKTEYERNFPGKDSSEAASRSIKVGVFTEYDKNLYELVIERLDVITKQREEEDKYLNRLSGSGYDSLAAEKAMVVNAAGGAASTGQVIIASANAAEDRRAQEETLKKASEQAEYISSRVSELISQNIALSSSAQLDSLEQKIKEITEARNMVSKDSPEFEKLSEIIEGFEEQKKALLEIGDKDVSDFADSLKKAADILSTYGSAFASVFDSIASYASQIWQNQIDAVDKMLSESESRWDKYLDHLNDKQELQKDSLAHLYDAGLVSLEEYNQATKQMYDDKSRAEKEAEKEQEELKAKQNELKKKQFESDKVNNIAQAMINGAMAITNIWANNAANPVACGILSALSAASTAAQIATISSQRFTPMASGGIVSSPTYALLGEGGAKEAVLPLTESNMRRAGLSSDSDKSIVINISVGTSYSGDQLSADVFKGIERAQRTGLLPNWRYA